MPPYFDLVKKSIQSFWGRNLLLFSFFLALLFWAPSPFHGDQEFWLIWARCVSVHSFEEIYLHHAKVSFNYTPLILYFLKAYTLFQPNTAAIQANLDWFRFFPLAFDFIPLVVLANGIALKNKAHYAPWGLLFSGVYLYNTLLWGQVDAIHSTFIFLAILVLPRSVALSIACFVLALNMKMQSIVFLPVLGLAWLYYLRGWKSWLVSFVTLVVTQLVIIWPILPKGLAGLMSIIESAAQVFPIISANAFNFWVLVFGKDFMWTSDLSIGFWSLSFRQWGQLLFFLLSAFALAPVVIMIVKAYFIKEMERDILFSILFLVGGIVALLFFFFNTQMHERYSHPALILFFMYGFFTKRYFLFGLTSLAYFLNMEGALMYYGLDYAAWWFNPRIVAMVFSFTIIMSFIHLYRFYFLEVSKAISRSRSV